MTRCTMTLGVAILGGLLAVACGGGGQNNSTGSVPASNAAAGNVEVTLTSQPDPPRTGENTFEVMVMSGGQPVTDADVAVEFFMAAMPEMKMPEMRNSVPLNHEGAGRYRGAGTVMMAGAWDVTVRVRRGGEEIGSRQFDITAQ